MFINIITPCSRPNNLHAISKSINFPKKNYRWIVVFDFNELPPKELIPDNCEFYLHKDPNSILGNAQRNFALDLVKEGYVYFNDDDTIIHENLWENIRNLKNDFISFYQSLPNGNIRLFGQVRYQAIDTHNFILSKELIGDCRWVLNKYEADGIFATECYKKSQTPLILEKVLSIYNCLR
jgi:hypothetical protein